MGVQLWLRLVHWGEGAVLVKVCVGWRCSSALGWRTDRVGVAVVVKVGILGWWCSYA